MRDRRPTFFIVGAPRCGTTSLTYFLAQHSEIFVPEIKVPMHFGKDLDMPIKHYLRDERNYLALFQGARDGQVCGESTVFYLYSRFAASEIRAFDPDARIIIMLRSPVEMMYSMHARNLLDGNEDRQDFAQALMLEADRKQGRSIPRAAHYPQALFYRELAQYYDQVKRFKDNFPDEQILVILMDDIKRDVGATFSNVLRFLGIDDGFAGDVEKANQSQSVRSTTITHFLKSPPAILRMLPRRAQDAIRWRLKRWNLGGLPRAPVSDDLRSRLLSEFEADISSLGNLIDRDLRGWMT